MEFLTAALIVCAMFRPETAGRDTTLQTATFSATLPGSWARRPSPDAFVFTRGDDSVFITKIAPQGEPSDRVAMRIADTRRKLINDLARGKANLTSIEKATDGAKTMLSFHGEDPQNGKRLHIAVIAFKDIVVTTAVYRPLAAPSKGFDELARSVMLSIRAVR